MRYRFIAFDLDGTALKSDRTMSPRLRAACRQAASRGAVVAICSGRIYRSTLPFSQFLDIDAPVINCQGAVICDAKSAEVLYSRPLERSMLCDAVAFLRAHNHYVQVNTNDAFYYERESDWSAYYASLQGFSGVKVKDLTRDLTQTPAKVVGLADPKTTLECYHQAKEQFADRMEIAISVPQMLEFTHPLANKGTALAWISAHYQIAPQEMIAVGDSLNDIPMIRFAGLGAAVANARKETLEAADLVVPSNDEDGVAYLIEEYMLKG